MLTLQRAAELHSHHNMETKSTIASDGHFILLKSLKAPGSRHDDRLWCVGLCYHDRTGANVARDICQMRAICDQRYKFIGCVICMEGGLTERTDERKTTNKD